MFHIEDVLQLKDNEDIKTLARRHPVTMAPGLGLALLLIVAPFFFLFPLFGWGLPGLGVFAVSITAGIVIAIRTLLLWDSDVIVVSSLRLVDVDQKGVFSRYVTEVALSAVQDVVWKRKGIIDTIFNVGSLEIQQAGSSQKMTVTRVGKPESIHELINDLRRATRPLNAEITAEKRERIRQMASRMEELTDEQLARIENAVKNESRESALKKFLHRDETPAA